MSWQLWSETKREVNQEKRYTEDRKEIKRNRKRKQFRKGGKRREEKEMERGERDEYRIVEHE